MPEDFRRLKRGLKDISPLFGEVPKSPGPRVFPAVAAPPPMTPRAVAPAAKGPPVTCLGSLVAETPQNSYLLSQVLAKKLALRYGPCSIVSLLGSSNNNSDSNAPASAPFVAASALVKHLTLSENQFDWVCSRASPLQKQAGEASRFLFLDFDYESLSQLHRALPLLDQWILYVRPALASLTEAYRMIKMATRIRPQLECFLVVEGNEGDSSAGRLYEVFSDYVSRRLGVSLSWLGALTLPRPLDLAAVPLVLDSLLGQAGTGMSSIEKRAIAGLVATGGVL